MRSKPAGLPIFRTPPSAFRIRQMLLEKTQRRLCRLLFLAGCVLPTLAVAGFTTSRLRPAYADGLLATVGEALGAVVECEGVTTPRPGVYELRNARLRDARSGDQFAACDVVRVDARRATLRLAAREVAARRPLDAWLAGLMDDDWAIEATIAQLRLDDGPPWRGVSATLGIDGFRATCAGGAAVESRLAGDHYDVTAETGEAGVAADWIPAAPLRDNAVGADRFRGSLRLRAPLDGGPTGGLVVGRIDLGPCDFAGLTAARGTIDVEELRFEGPRVERLAGRFELRDGRIARPVVYGMCRWLAMEPFAPLERDWADAATESFPFTQLACEVELDPSGLVLVAGCGEIDGRTRGGAVAHAVVERDGVPLLKEPSWRPLPAQRLVQAWRPDDPAELPASAASVRLAGALPGLGVE